MTPRSLAASALAALLFVACDEDPTDPATNASINPPRAAIVGSPSNGTGIFRPLPGATDVTIVASGGGWVGSSGGRAVFWDGDGQPTELAGLDEATDIASGATTQIVGSVNGHAAYQQVGFGFLPPDEGTGTDLGTLPGDDRSEATATDIGIQSNLVVGDSWSGDRASNSRAFIWKADPSTLPPLTELPPLPGHVAARALSVSGLRGGVVVGVSYPGGGAGGEIVVWEGGEPTAIGYDYDTYFPHGLQRGVPYAAFNMSNRGGNEVVEWADGSTSVLRHPYPKDPNADYSVVGTSNEPDILYKLEVNEPLVPYYFGIGTYSGDFVPVGALPLDDCAFPDVCTSPMRQYPFRVLHAARPAARVRDLTVTRNGTTSVRLEWTQVDDGAGGPANYRVKYSEPPLSTGPSWHNAPVGCNVEGDAIGTCASCTVTGLDPETPYDFMLMSYRREDGLWVDANYSTLAVGQTGWNGGDEGLACVSRPGVVRDLTVTNQSTSTITLHWTQVNDGTGSPAWYRVKYAEPPIDWKTATIGCDNRIEGDALGAEISCTVEGLEPATTYEFQLMSYRVVDGKWVDARYSNITFGLTAQRPAPRVDDVAVMPGRTSMEVHWTQIDDGTGQPAHYRVKYGPPPFDWNSGTIGCGWNIVGDEIGADISCTIEGLDPGTAYDVQLVSFRIEGGGLVSVIKSNVASGKTLATDAPARVDDLAIASQITATSMTLSWTQVDDGTGRPAWYRLKYAEPPMAWGEATIGCDRTMVGDAIGETMSCTIEGLDPGTTYDVQVKSFRAEDGFWVASTYSNLVSGATAAPNGGPDR
jgi:hypothetical protein